MKRTVLVILLMLGVGLLLTLLLIFGLSRASDGSRGATTDPLVPVDRASGLEIGSFDLIDQNGDAIDRTALEGQVTILDFVFTNCPLACPMMTSRMKAIADELDGSGVRFMSFSLDPERDTPERLIEYAGIYDIDLANWTFVTGDQEQTWRLAREGLTFSIEDDPSIQITLPDGSMMSNIAHPEWFVLVGPDTRVLDIFRSSEPSELRRLVDAARRADRGVSEVSDRYRWRRSAVMLNWTVSSAVSASAFRTNGTSFGGLSSGCAGARPEGKPIDRSMAKLVDAIDKSSRARRARSDRQLDVTFPRDLPIARQHEEIGAAIRENQVVIVCGETGSGKTTQLPKICLALGRGVDGVIGHTQPRRIAARSVAHRIAEELRTKIGDVVGYKVRFADETSPACSVKLMTDGILLAETQSDRDLRKYDTLIIDEAHERSLNIDFLIGYLHGLIARRRDLKVIITSATIDPQSFSDHFGGAPIVEVPGRSYPVDIRYRSASEVEEGEEGSVRRAIADAVDEATGEGPGDILVFLPGEREIRDAAKMLRGRCGDDVEILPLYARLSTKEQNRVFRSHRGRRIVLATNVAETSLTVPGIRYVIDPGLARISRYAHRSRVQRLQVEAISQASANQRSGRCGRIGPGIAYRLYGEGDFETREAFTPPEVLRTNLASVILQMKALRLGRPDAFPFIEPPKPTMIREGFRTLAELGAIDEHSNLTEVGRKLARLPIDPRLGRMVVAGDTEDALREVLIIASALAVQDPRERPLEARDAADAAHEQFHDESSDFLVLLNIWRFYHEKAEELSRSALRRLLKQTFISPTRMREWLDTHTQLRSLLKEEGYRFNSKDAAYDQIHRAILTGLLSTIGYRRDEYEYSGAHGGGFFIYPGSGLFQRRPHWVVAGEVVETTRRYARTVARVKPQWIEAVTPPELLKRTYSEPHYDDDKAHVGAFERVMLHGLELVSRRKVHYGPIDPAHARRVFIEQGLVAGRYRSRAPYAAHNHRLIDQATTQRQKRRIAEDQEWRDRCFAFFDAKLGGEAFNGSRFERWRKRAERDDPKVLFLPDDAFSRVEGVFDPEEYPDELVVGDVRLPLTYLFEPNDAADGVTVHLTPQSLSRVPPERFDWIVPGVLREKITALIRKLPKHIRTQFIPVPDFVDACMHETTFGEGDLIESITNVLAKRTDAVVPRDAWRIDDLPAHLRLNLRVTDEDGTPLAEGRDVERVMSDLQSLLSRQFASIPKKSWERSGVCAWDFGALPTSVDLEHAGMAVKAFPTLVDRGESVTLTVFEHRDEAEDALFFGVRRLFRIRGAKEIDAQVRHLPGLDSLRLLYAPHGASGPALEDAIALVGADLAFRPDGRVRDAKAFEARFDDGWSRVGSAVIEAGELIGTVLERANAVEVGLERLGVGGRGPGGGADGGGGMAEAVDDIGSQLSQLLTARFLATVSADRLRHYPRYLDGAVRRIDRLARGGQIEADARLAGTVRPFWSTYLQLVEALPRPDVDLMELARFRWMIEEFRVAVFAQELRTSQPVSVERLQRQWLKIKRR